MVRKFIKRKEYVGTKALNNEAVHLYLSCGHSVAIYRRVDEHGYNLAKYQIIQPCSECDPCIYNKTGE